MPRKRLTIRIADDHGGLDGNELVEALTWSLQMLDDVDKNSNDGKATVKWPVVDVTKRSPVAIVFEPFTAVPEAKHKAATIVRRFTQGIRRLRQKATIPPYFSRQSLGLAQKIIALQTNGIAFIEYVASGERPVRFTRQVDQHVQSVMSASAPQSYQEDTELDGTLQAISLHPKTPEFAIYDSLTGDRIPCHFNRKELNTIADMLKHESRIVVGGRATYKEGRPVSIVVSHYRALPTEGELPSMKDLQDAGINITGDELPEDYVRKLRDG